VERQTGAVSAIGFEAWVDALMGFSLLPEKLGPNLAVISGPGGLAVSAAEACGNEGLNLAVLSEPTQSRLSEFVPSTGTSLRNPVDVSLSGHFDLTIFKRAAEAVSRDAGVDAVVIIGGGLTPEDSQTFIRYMIEVQQESRKPLLMVTIPGHEPSPGPQFCRAGIPFFDSAERAMKTYALAYRYRRWREKQAGTS
jgi:acyl-CoA synthetase (NDP forming)